MRLKPLVDVIIDHKNVNSALVVDGYQCIDRSLSKVIEVRNKEKKTLLAIIAVIGQEAGWKVVAVVFPGGGGRTHMLHALQ